MWRPQAVVKEVAAAGSNGKKRGKSEIDDIFSLAKKPPSEAAGHGAAAEPKSNTGKDGAADGPAPKKPKVQGSKDDIFGQDVAKGGRKKTEEGYAIYTEDELGLGRKGGDTDQCPFDCDCCFI